MNSEMSDSEFEETLSEDPGNPIFAEYAESLRVKNELDKAMHVCLRGLSVNPDFHKGRLLLARIMFLKEYTPFVIRELEHLIKVFPDNKSIKKILTKLSPYSFDNVHDNDEVVENEDKNKETEDVEVDKVTSEDKDEKEDADSVKETESKEGVKEEKESIEDSSEDNKEKEENEKSEESKDEAKEEKEETLAEADFDLDIFDDSEEEKDPK